jgi:anaerobic ribonucleoside-triphosphate reductase
MNQLKMNPSRDAGRFAYHLKFLLKAHLVEVDSEAKKYYLTDLGKMVIDVADRVEKKAVKPKGMLVRTSHFTFEEFDGNKITNSLIREAKMPPDQAQKTAKETEKLLVKSKIKYLTSPLIRETVNSILIEKGFEDYRHKLTRVGLPVHEVSTLIEAKNPLETGPILETAGRALFREYTLLSVFPRDIADAHVSGAIHLNGLSSWVLKPSEVMHDLRFFFRNGLCLQNLNPQQHSNAPPRNFEEALDITFNVLLLTKQELNEVQTLDHFNVFLAPYAKGVEKEEIKKRLRLFILNANKHSEIALGIDLEIPDYLMSKLAAKAAEKSSGKYADYSAEAKLLSALIIDLYAEESSPKPLLKPNLLIKITPQALTDKEQKENLQKAHLLAAGKSSIFFVNALRKDDPMITFSGSGIKFSTDLNEDWETDTLRTGCLGYVTINLPRISHESEGEKNKFFDLLKERCELSLRALNIKYKALRQHGKTAMPFLIQNVNGDAYFRLENCVGIINLAGLDEAVEDFTKKPLSDPECAKFSQEIAQNTQSYINKIGRRHGKRFFAAVRKSPEASARLAQLDVERYGIAKVKISGAREKPFYSTTRRLKLQTGNFLHIPTEQLEIEKSLKKIAKGGNLCIIDINGLETRPEDLLKLTLSLMENHRFELLTYNQKVTYCTNCQKSWSESLRKCPSCGAIGTLVNFDGFEGT